MLAEVTTPIGIIGATIILVAFLLNQTGRWHRDSFSYDLANALGAALLILYSWLIASYPFLILNLVWFFSAARDLWRR
jgi:hypothetical protein